MSTAGEHTKLLTAAAREVLKPEGLSQKGRSRTWLDDHGWWLGVVEFQPSSWSKGSYLNAGACFLWSDLEHLTFDLGYRQSDFVEFESSSQFAPQAKQLAVLALERIQELRSDLSSVQAASDTLRTADEVARRDFHSGVALGLVGDSDLARETLLRQQASLAGPRSNTPDWVTKERDDASRLADLVDDQLGFIAATAQRVEESRQQLGLPRVSISFD